MEQKQMKSEEEAKEQCLDIRRKMSGGRFCAQSEIEFVRNMYKSHTNWYKETEMSEFGKALLSAP